MKGLYSEPVEAGRVTAGLFQTPRGDSCGKFHVRAPSGEMLQIIASNGDGWEFSFPLPAWEHVSVSHARRCPTWEEMAWVKSQFWNDDECVIQFHPAKQEYVNNHPYCLHMWKPVGVEIPTPPSMAVGFTADPVPASTAS